MTFTGRVPWIWFLLIVAVERYKWHNWKNFELNSLNRKILRIILHVSVWIWSVMINDFELKMIILKMRSGVLVRYRKFLDESFISGKCIEIIQKIAQLHHLFRPLFIQKVSHFPHCARFNSFSYPLHSSAHSK